MNILQGTDIPVILELKAADGTTIIEPSSLVDYNVYLFADIQGVRQLKLVFRKTPTGDEIPIHIEDDAAGEIKVIIPRTYTAIAPKANHYLELKIQDTADSDYIDSVFTAPGEDSEGNNQFLVGLVGQSAFPKGLI